MLTPVNPTMDTPAEALLGYSATTDQFQLVNWFNGISGWIDGETYAGPYAPLQTELINPSGTGNPTVVTAYTPDVYVVASSLASQNNAVNLSFIGGTNVVESGAGSNFITDSTGTDTIFMNAQTTGSPGALWDTVVGFQGADAVTLWGVTAADFNVSWLATAEGATGNTGLTLNVGPNDGPVERTPYSMNLTFAGVAPSASGNFNLTYGTQAGLNYLQVTLK